MDRCVIAVRQDRERELQVAGSPVPRAHAGGGGIGSEIDGQADRVEVRGCAPHRTVGAVFVDDLAQTGFIAARADQNERPDLARAIRSIAGPGRVKHVAAGQVPLVGGSELQAAQHLGAGLKPVVPALGDTSDHALAERGERRAEIGRRQHEQPLDRATCPERVVSRDPFARHKAAGAVDDQVERFAQPAVGDGLADDVFHAPADVFDADIVIHGNVVAEPDLRGLVTVIQQEFSQRAKRCGGIAPAVDDGDLCGHATPGILASG